MSNQSVKFTLIPTETANRNQIKELIDRANITYEAFADNPYEEIAKIKATSIVETLPSINNNNDKIKESSIPRFDGNVLTYQRFKKQFYEIVINTTVSNAIKYEYLKTAVKESRRALDIVCNAQDEESIEQIFKMLDLEYDSPIIIFDEVRAQINKCAKFNSSTDFKGWDAIYNVLAKAKQRINDPVQIENIKLQIMAKLPNDVMPSLRANNEHNLEFIFKYRAKSQTKRPQNFEQPSYQRQQQYRQQNIPTNQCPLCKQTNHKIDKCPKLTTTNLTELISKLKTAKVCIKCGNHRFRNDQQCNQTCLKCNGNHATYLCKNNRPRPAQVNSIDTVDETTIQERRRILEARPTKTNTPRPIIIKIMIQ
ncbi:hypothetical protein DERP_015321 [Dermatophagoides pteronyssinus]|uniref:Uncharacterized protein n=1 Tax=Dermatophagoides pteronyssinus TaxID=6956 RepID=A0ABQ8IRL0_DERPT|nr:hypothetical protein DERP_015321 [Dermatophagoides pteronyssinus]